MLVIGHMVFLGLALKWPIIEDIPPGVTMAWVGVSYSMYASAIWPTLPFIIQQDMIGTAYGAMTSVQNFGLAFFPFVIGLITDSKYIHGTNWAYVIPILFFIVCAGISLGLTCFMYILDLRTTGGVLNDTGTKKKAYQKEVLNAKPPIMETKGYDIQ